MLLDWVGRYRYMAVDQLCNATAGDYALLQRTIRQRPGSPVLNGCYTLQWTMSFAETADLCSSCEVYWYQQLVCIAGLWLGSSQVVPLYQHFWLWQQQLVLQQLSSP